MCCYLGCRIEKRCLDGRYLGNLYARLQGDGGWAGFAGVSERLMVVEYEGSDQNKGSLFLSSVRKYVVRILITWYRNRKAGRPFLESK